MVIDKHNQGWAEYVDNLEKQNRDLRAALDNALQFMRCQCYDGVGFPCNGCGLDEAVDKANAALVIDKVGE